MTCDDNQNQYPKASLNLEELKQMLSVVNISRDEFDSLSNRVEEAATYGMSLSKSDGKVLKDTLNSYAYIQEQLAANDLTIKKLRKLLGMESSSESHPSTGDRDSNEEKASKENSKPPTENKGHGKRGADDFKDAGIEHHKLDAASKGDPCPDCHKGKLYKYEPSVMIRISAHSPYEVTKHVCERLRCNACGIYITATPSKEVLDDGPKTQRYGYSARALIAIDKYMAGSPFYRQQNLTKLLGTPISASTAFDQCEKLADAGHIIHKELSQKAAQAKKMYIDDTRNRIRDAQAIVKNGKKRSGVYSSVLVAEGEQDVVLFKTNIGHAGEFLDEILEKRSQDLEPPIVMSDALSSNHITSRKFEKTLCNVHARREFNNLKSIEPIYINPILDRYQEIFRNEGHIRTEKLSPTERLEYHKKHSLGLMQEILDESKSLIDSKVFEENSLFGKAFKYFKRHWHELTAFCRIEGAGLDNNISERALKIIILGRKNAYFFKTEVGAAVSNTITSILATCKWHDVNAFEYLKTIQRYQDSIKAEPQKWMPWNYRASLLDL